MIVVAQRVTRASVRVDGEVLGAIDQGLCLLACAVQGDELEHVAWLGDKLADLRVFADDEGRTNRSLVEVGGAALVVPQFTLAADWRKGRRPSFTRAAAPELARARVAELCAHLEGRGLTVSQGRFGSLMSVELVNDGPFTLVLDSDEGPFPR